MKFIKLVKASDIPANTRWKWKDYANGTVGGFFQKLCEAIEVADDSNLALLKKAYPNLINLFEHRFDGTDGVI